MRVTFRSIDDGIDALNTAAEQFSLAQRQVATGRRLQSPSDDPSAAMRIIQGTNEIGTIDAYTRANDTAGSRLTVLDNVLGTIVDRLTEAQAAAAQGRGTTADAATREALAEKLRGIRDGLVGDFNTTFRGTSLLSGAEAQTEAYAQVAGVWTYQGSTDQVTVDIGRGRDVAVALDGQAIAQGADASDLFTEFDALITAVQAADEAGMTTGMDALQRAFNRAVRAQSGVGIDLTGIEQEQQNLASFRVANLKAISLDRDANMAEAITEMSQADTAYRAALQAVGATSKVSLMDYLG
ncbi:MAG: hypothetical protein AB7P34_06465 [Vicinamibacterales bacterium]